MPRRVADYLDSDGCTSLNRVSSVGRLPRRHLHPAFLWNVWRTLRKGELAGDDPWEGHTLEWATSSPPAADELRPPAAADPVQPPGVRPDPRPVLE